MRASVRHHTEIAVPADAAWAVVTRADVLQHWFPGLTSVTWDGEVRTVTTGTGLSLGERVITDDALARRFQYRIEGRFFREHLATVDVFELGSDRCLVSYASDADPATMAIVLGGAMQAALASLQQQLEAGEGPVLDAIAVPAVLVAATTEEAAS